MTSALERLQEETRELLRSRSELAGVEVLSYRSSDLASALQVYAREPLGICAIVMPPLPLSFRESAPHRGAATVELRVRVVENIGSHRGARRALECAEMIHRIICGASLSCGNSRRTLLPAGNSPWSIGENFPESTLLEIELRFWAQMFLKPAESGGGEL
ncbi:MAG: hypothetical protein LBI39_04005 [Puniceicoccales bacterium]|nr:hypothetical protein [Puniceicoccales bacterium]